AEHTSHFVHACREDGAGRGVCIGQARRIRIEIACQPIPGNHQVIVTDDAAQFLACRIEIWARKPGRWWQRAFLHTKRRTIAEAMPKLAPPSEIPVTGQRTSGTDLVNKQWASCAYCGPPKI